MPSVLDPIQNPVAFLRELVSVPSVSGHEEEVGRFLAACMEHMGLAVTRDAVGNVVGTIGDALASDAVLLLGHMDTVPGEIPVRRQENLLFGRGAVDAKGPLATFLVAAGRAKAAFADRPLVVIGGVGEEADSRGARYLAGKLPRPRCVIIGEPSGWDSITLGYKGTMSVRLRMSRPCGHSANGQPAPVEDAVAFWDRLQERTSTLNDGEAWRFSTVDATLRSLNTSSDGLTDLVEMHIGLRLPPAFDFESLKKELSAWLPGAEVTFPYADPCYRSGKNSPLVRAMLRGIRESGAQPRFKVKTGSSDMNVIGPIWKVPIVAYGPGDSSLDHTPNEHIDVEEYLRSIDVLTHALELLAETDWSS